WRCALTHRQTRALWRRRDLLQSNLLKRFAKQRGVFEIESGQRDIARAYQLHRIEPPANPGLPNRVLASARSKPAGRNQKQKLKTADRFLQATRVDRSAHALPMVAELIVANVVVVDPKTLVQREQMRRREEPDARCRLPQQRSAHGGGRALAVRADNNGAVRAERAKIDPKFCRHRSAALQPRACSKLRIGHAPDVHLSAASKLARQISMIRSQRPFSSNVAIIGLEFTSITASSVPSPERSNRSTAASDKPIASAA